MADFKKVIESLECCEVGAECDHCHYAKGNHGNFEGCHQLMADAVEVLKEQHTVIEKYHKADSFLEAHGWKWE